MASLLAHAAIPFVTRSAARAPAALERRLLLVAIFCATWADLDFSTLAFEVRPNEIAGHRGLTHSLFVATLVGVACAFAFFRSLGVRSRAFARVAIFLVLAGASHGLLDAMTTGQDGVALFWPFDSARHMLPFRLLASCPLGLDEAFGTWGFFTFANELLYVVLPLALVVTLLREPERRARVAVTAVLWALAVPTLRIALPQYFRPTEPREIRPIDTPAAGRLADIPRDGLPDEKLLTRLDDLRPLFDVELTPSQAMWSSTFFPSWLGSYGGRWTEGAPRLVWRTLVGFSAPTSEQAHGWLAAAARGDATAQHRLFTLAPAEKLDIAFGHFDFPAEKQALSYTHNQRPRPRYWNGVCGGVASASIAHAEPFRVVDVTNATGDRIRFHPQDIKALLALSYALPKETRAIGELCDTIGFDSGATCSMNPAVLVVALANRLGVAKKSFLVDALPTVAQQYYAVAGAKIRVLGAPRPLGRERIDPALAPRVRSLVDVAMDLTLSSTVLPYERADIVASADGTHYARVGVVPVPMHYAATLALDESGALVGGVWTGDPPDGPDDVYLVGDPALLPNGNLQLADQIPFSFVERLADASANEGPGAATIDLR